MIDMLRTLLLTAVLLTGGAESAFADTYEVASYYELRYYCEGVSHNPVNNTITLGADIIATDGITIPEDITIDLNGYNITGNNGNVITIDEGITLTIVDNSDGTVKGSIIQTNEDYGFAITGNNGSTLVANGVTFTCAKDRVINFDGSTLTLTGCTITGLNGITSYGETIITGCTFNCSGTAIDIPGGNLALNTVPESPACTINGGKVGLGIGTDETVTVTIGSNVIFNQCTESAINYFGGTFILEAWPIFGTGENKNASDIKIFQGRVITFGDGITGAPDRPIAMMLVDGLANPVSSNDLPIGFTSNYSEKVKENDNVIDPNRVFVYYDDTKGFSFGIDASGDVNVGKYAASFTAYYEGNILETMTFETFDEAFSSMLEYLENYSGETSDLVLKLKLLSDVDLGDMPIDIACGKKIFNMVLDLNGHTLSSTDENFIIIHVGNSLTIEDSGNGGRLVYTALFGINCEGTLTLKTLPNFEYGGNSEHADIMLQSEPIIHFGEGNFVEPSNPIIVGGIPERVVFTDGYSDNVKSGDDIIDPAFVFRLQMLGLNFVCMMDGESGEVVFMPAPPDDVFLFDADDNNGKIWEGRYCNVILGGRIMTKDGTWNTLCLPFDVEIASSPLAGAEVKTLDPNNSNLDSNGDLNLTFVDAGATIEAGLPYIIKWTKPDNYVPYDPDLNNFDECDDLTDADLVFYGVTIKSPEPIPVIFNNELGDDCQFVGQYSPFLISDDDAALGFYTDHGHIDEILFFAKGDATSSTVLGYSASERTLRACRTHFWAPVLQTAGGEPVSPVRSFVLDFGDGNDATGVVELKNSRIEELNSDDGWYSMDGRKLSGEPKAKGLYIHNGKKIIIK